MSSSATGVSSVPGVPSLGMPSAPTLDVWTMRCDPGRRRPPRARRGCRRRWRDRSPRGRAPTAGSRRPRGTRSHAGHRAAQGRAVEEVALRDLDGDAREGPTVAPGPREHAHRGAGAQQLAHDVGADEARAARDERVCRPVAMALALVEAQVAWPRARGSDSPGLSVRPRGRFVRPRATRDRIGFWFIGLWRVYPRRRRRS